MKRILADVCPELINEWSQRNLPLTPKSVMHCYLMNGAFSECFEVYMCAKIPRRNERGIVSFELLELLAFVCGLIRQIACEKLYE